jgi:aminopeptidase YwaD
MSIDTSAVVRELSDCIGVRPAGSINEAAAANYLNDLLTREGWSCERQTFEYRGWTAGLAGSITATGDAKWKLDGLVFPYTFPTPATGISGRIVEGGVASIIPDRVICERFYLLDEAGGRIGRILVAPFDDLRPVPNPRPTDSLQTLVLGRSTLALLSDSVKKGAHVELRCPSGEVLAGGTNIITETRGDGGPGLLIVAHYDSVSGSPGANDNASGVAVALSQLEHAQRNGYPVRLLLAAAEELMFLGAQAYLAQLQDENRQAEVVACLCLDMLGVGDTLKLRAPKGGLWHEAGLQIHGEAFLHREMPSSDHWVFHEVGIPSAQLTRQVDPEYHSSRDISSRIRSATLSESVSVASRLIDEVAPRLNFGRKRARNGR